MFHYIMPHLYLRVERWKWNSTYGFYVSNKGRFRDVEKKPMPLKVGNGGYMKCWSTHLRKWCSCHRVVAEVWMPTFAMEHLTVDHLDHNKRNNAVDNLEWVEQAENQWRAARDFLRTPTKPAHIKFCFSNENEVTKYLEELSAGRACLKASGVLVNDAFMKKRGLKWRTALIASQNKRRYGGFEWRLEECGI